MAAGAVQSMPTAAVFQQDEVDWTHLAVSKAGDVEDSGASLLRLALHSSYQLSKRRLLDAVPQFPPPHLFLYAFFRLLLKADHFLLWVFAKLLGYYHGGAFRHLADNLLYAAFLTPPLPKPSHKLSKLPRVRNVLSLLLLVSASEGVLLLQLFKLSASNRPVPFGESAEVCLYGVDGGVYVLSVPAGNSIHSRQEAQPGDCYRVFVYIEGNDHRRRLTLRRYVEYKYCIPPASPLLQHQRGGELGLFTKNFPPVEPEPLVGLYPDFSPPAGEGYGDFDGGG